MPRTNSSIKLSGEDAKAEKPMTTGETEVPGPKLFDDITSASYKGAIFQAGLELEVWEKIASGQRTSDDIVRKEGWDPVGTRILLDALCSFGLLAKDKLGYHLVPIAELYLLPGKSTYMGESLLSDLRWEDNGRLAEGIRTGRRPLKQLLIEDESARIWAASRAPRRAAPYRDIGKIDAKWESLMIEVHERMRILDVACGSGISTLAFARNHPGVSVTLLDRPAVLEVALEIADKLGVTERVTAIPGDVRSASLGHDVFDLVWFGYILHFFGPDDVITLLTRANDALVPSGIIVLDTFIPNETLSPSEDATIFEMWTFCVSKGGSLYAFPEWRSFLEEAGFINVTRIGETEETCIKATKP